MAGTITQVLESLGNGEYCLSFTCTADASDGSFPSTTASLEDILGYVTCVVTNPGATAPTANYDIVLNDADGDVMGGALANRSATVTEQVVPLAGSLGFTRFVKGTITPVITNNSVNSAIVVIRVYFFRNEK